MNRYKLPLLLLLSLTLILAGAFLPRLSASWLDMSAGSQSGYAPISNVQLEFNEAGQSMDMGSKLALLKGYTDSMELPTTLATLNLDTDQVTGLVLDTIRRYYAAGLLPGVGSISRKQISAQPYLVSWSKDAGQGNIFWNVSVNMDDLYQQSLFLILDDQTGTVCIFDYTDNEAPLKRPDMPTVMAGLCETYLGGLGKDFFSSDPAVIARDAKFNGTPEDTLLAYHSWSDILYGEVTLNFCVTESKIYVALS